MKLFAGLCFFVVCVSSAFSMEDWQGTVSEWHGYPAYAFSLQERECKVVLPKQSAPGKPWIWRARFWGHEPQVDLALLDKGFHVVYMDVAGLYGSDQAVALWDAFYRFLLQKGLSSQCVLEGMSRGGLILYRWASQNADKVACLYADAPVCDMNSWPGGKGRGPGSASDWEACLKAYGMTPAQMAEYQGHPKDVLAPLAKAKIPLLHVCGLADLVVPVEENTYVLQKNYEKLGGFIQVIGKEGVGHHPHSLQDPEPIVSFILKHTNQNG